MTVLGIDPGKKGAIAVFDKNEHRVVTHDMPDTTLGLHDLLSSLAPVSLCVLERPFYPQAIGVTNAAKIAEAFGILKGALAWLSIPTQEVRPADWKAALGLSSSKAASREKASQIFPDDAAQWARVRDDGRAEAALLAWHGMKWSSK